MMCLLSMYTSCSRYVDHRCFFWYLDTTKFFHRLRSNVKPPHYTASPQSTILLSSRGREWGERERERQRGKAERKTAGKMSELFYYSVRFIGNYLSLVHWHWRINKSVGLRYIACVWKPARENAARGSKAKRCYGAIPNMIRLWWALLDMIALLTGSPRWNISGNHCQQLPMGIVFFSPPISSEPCTCNSAWNTR